MNKATLAELVHAKIGGTKTQSEEVVQSIFDAITASLKKGDEVSIAGFGIFSTVKKAARIGRNPKTGEAVTIAAKTAPKFKPGIALKNAVK
jgi:DNA-binding protein HU-beta